MALKRKDSDSAESKSNKKFCRGIRDDPYNPASEDHSEHLGSQSDVVIQCLPVDPLVAFTDDGRPRAPSEAQREWKYACNVERCGQRFNRPSRLEEHMRGHNKIRPFVCSFEGCDKDFPRKDHLNRHFLVAHSGADIDKPCVCDWEGCGKAFTSASRLKRHKEVHDTKFYCTGFPPCKEAFRKQKTLDAHIKSKHMIGDPFPCAHIDQHTGERCTRGYQTEQALRRHMVKNHGERDEDFMFFCLKCAAPGSKLEMVHTADGIEAVAKEPLAFATQAELTSHTNEFHPPICNQCGIRISRKENLKTHYLTAHAKPEDRPQYPCAWPDCGKVFTREHNLKVHMDAVHEEKKKFTCDTTVFADSKKLDLKEWDGNNACGATFKAKASLEQHVRTHHLNMKNRKEMRKLAKVSKKKPEPSALRLLTGIGDDGGRDFACSVRGCDSRFFFQRDLKRHLRSVHKMENLSTDTATENKPSLEGGQFWIGGIDDNMFDSMDSSMAPTPSPYHMLNPYMGADIPADVDMKTIDPQLMSAEEPPHSFKLSLRDPEEEQLDMEMGIGHVEMWNMANGLPRGL